jgi:hypothetical protein
MCKSVLRESMKWRKKSTRGIYDKQIDSLKEIFIKIERDSDLLAAACHKGLTRMFQTSYFPVLPKVLVANSVSPMEWFRKTFELSRGFSTQLIEYCFKTELHTANEKLKKEGLPCEEPGEVSGRIPRILKWSELFPILISESSLLRDLGLIWYLDGLCDEEAEWIASIGDLVGLSKLIERVHRLAYKLEEKTLIREAGEEQPIVRWSDVFRLPL